MKILIFKTDRIGDLVNISSVFYNLKKNYPNSEISLVCSKYNSSISKYYDLLSNILIFNKPFYFFLFQNFKFLFSNKFDLILQLDGKNHSYLSTLFIRSKKKVALKFKKKKNYLGFNFNDFRPNYFISFFFDILIECNESYDVHNNKSYHYLSLYLKLLENLNIKIFSKDHFITFKGHNNNLPKNYYHIHIDERWNSFNSSSLLEFENKLNILSENNVLVVTSNINGNNYFLKLSNNLFKNKNIFFLNDVSVDDLINIIYNSHTVISSHTGFIVHVAACFKKKIIDIVSPDIFNELDRWIPFNVNYVRLSINNFVDAKF